MDAEFTRIPTIAAKADELPAGVEVKNRYANVIPLPETRVSLDPDDRGDDSAGDYINANYVKVSACEIDLNEACKKNLIAYRENDVKRVLTPVESRFRPLH